MAPRVVVMFVIRRPVELRRSPEKMVTWSPLSPALERGKAFGRLTVKIG